MTSILDTEFLYLVTAQKLFFARKSESVFVLGVFAVFLKHIENKDEGLKMFKDVMVHIIAHM